MARFETYPDIDKIAAAVHESYLDLGQRAELKKQISGDPATASWKIHPAVMRAYEELSSDLKASNRAAARRVPELLRLIDFVVVPLQQHDPDTWIKPLKDAIERHIDRLARAEHVGWCAERLSNGWTYGPIRDNERKHHPLLVDWSQLSELERDKDRNSARSIPDWLQVAGFKAVPLDAR